MKPNWQKQADHSPLGFGLRQSSGAFGGPGAFESGRGLPQSKTLPRDQSLVTGCYDPRAGPKLSKTDRRSLSSRYRCRYCN
jgi:hypothetical protein